VALQFSKFEEIEEKGNKYCLKMLKQWEEEGILPSVFLHEENSEGKEERSQCPMKLDIMPISCGHAP
jgi:hypothetical protein